MRVLILSVVLCTLLVGCGGGAGFTNFGKHPYTIANDKFWGCVGDVDTPNAPEGVEDITLGLEDPERARKLTLSNMISPEVKEYLMQWDTGFQMCAQQQLSDMSAIDHRLVTLWSDYFSDRMNLLTSVLKGDIETYGEFNQGIEDFYRVNARKERDLIAIIDREEKLAKKEADEEAERKWQERHQQARQAMQDYAKAMQYSNNAIQEYSNSLSRRVEFGEYNRTRTTNCQWIGSILQCQSF